MAWVAITEADIDNYAGMYLQHNGRECAIAIFASSRRPIEEPGIAVSDGDARSLAVARGHDRRPARTG